MDSVKKTIVSTALVCLAVRLAVLAGAGEAIGAWVQDLGADGLVPVTLRVELGAPVAQPSEDAVTEAPVPEEAEQAWMLVAVTPAPDGAEEAVNSGELQPAIPAVAADLSKSYTVHNRTAFDVDYAALAAAGQQLELEADAPQILIIHTHSSEAYTPDDVDRYAASDPYRTEDKNYSVIRVGDALAEKFEENGLTVIHDRELYDYPSYTGSYNRSGAAVEKYLADYPSIKVVIDLHRDALGSGDVVYKTQATLSGKTSAQVMMLVGTGENGLPDPYWQENLKLALYLQDAAETKYPGLARPIELVSERYNQQLSTGMMILEVGSSGNTLREALTAIDLFGEAAGKALAAQIAPET